MNADKELLELAAKAAGWKWWRSKHGYWNVIDENFDETTCCHGWPKFDAFTGEALPESTPADALAECDWDPLADNGDALRLAVKLRLEMYQSLNCGLWTVFVGYSKNGRIVYVAEQAGDDVFSATRRAIVRAAAEIGKTL